VKDTKYEPEKKEIETLRPLRIFFVVSAVKLERNE